MKRDVIVVGGGPAGFAAAIAAARMNADVLLLEQANRLGGTGVQGLVPMIRAAGDNGGVVREYWRRLEKNHGVVLTDSHAFVNPCVGGLTALEMTVESGAKILLRACAEGVKRRGNAIAGVFAATRAGRRLFSGKILIDATGDGDIAAWAGAPFDKGDPENGRLQAVSLNFMISGVAPERVPAKDVFGALVDAARKSGEIDAPPGRPLGPGSRQQGFPPDVFKYQFDLAFDVDPTDPESLSAGESLCQRRVLKYFLFLRNRVPGFENAALVNIATSLGVREGRRIRGEKTLMETDVLGAVKRPDGVCRASWYMDLHDGQNKEPLPEYRARRAPPPGDFYEVPYGCLVPLKVDNLLVAGRCVSSSRPANGSLRLQTTCVNLGEAAGTAAALCVQRGVSPRQLDGAELRLILRGRGMEI